MKTDKVKGLKIWTDKVGSNYYIKCETDTGFTLDFPYAIEKITDVFKNVVEILSQTNWEGVRPDTLTEIHIETYKKSRYETSKI